MPEMIQVTDLETGKTEFQSPLNARDLTTHRPDRFVIGGTTGSAPQKLREGEGVDAEIIDNVGNRRVKDNSRVIDRSQVSNTAHTNTTGALATGGDEDQIVKDEGVEDVDNDDDGAEDDANQDDANQGGGTSEGAPNGIVRSSSGELVDDELVTSLKGKSKQQLVAIADKDYGLKLDGRKSEDDLRLAIYDAAEKQ